jgi:hypothetical protein
MPAAHAPGVELMKTAAKKTATKKTATKKTATPILLSGGNPQIAKADGDAPVQAYIAAMPGWKPVPPVESKDPNTRYFHIHEHEQLDEDLLTRWIRQASELPGDPLF